MPTALRGTASWVPGPGLLSIGGDHAVKRDARRAAGVPPRAADGPDRGAGRAGRAATCRAPQRRDRPGAAPDRSLSWAARKPGSRSVARSSEECTPLLAVSRTALADVRYPATAVVVTYHRWHGSQRDRQPRPFRPVRRGSPVRQQSA